MFGVITARVGKKLLYYSQKNVIVGAIVACLACAIASDVRAQTLDVVPGEAEVRVFQGFEGGPFVAKTETVWTLDNAEVQEMSFLASSDEHWLTLIPESGILPGSLFLNRTIDVEAVIDSSEAASLMAGIYEATVKFTNLTNGAGTTTRTVRLEVVPSSFSISPTFVNAAAVVNGANPSPVNVTLTNDGQTDLNYSVSTPLRPWLSLDRTGGTVPGDGDTSFEVSFNVFGLRAGTHTSVITIENETNGAGTREIPVNLVVSPSSSGAMSLLPDRDISVSGPAGSIPEVDQISDVINGGDRWVSLERGVGSTVGFNNASRWIACSNQWFALGSR